MHIITRKRLNDYAESHPDSRNALDRWYRLLKKAEPADYAEMKQLFPSVDKVGPWTIFNVGGNKIRIITVIHYNRQKAYIRACLSHKEYDENKWKRD